VNNRKPDIAVVIPCYRATEHVVSVVNSIPEMVDTVIVVDDCCPDGSGELVKKKCSDKRVTVLRHDVNQGVGGAMVTGYRAALESGTDIVVKIDSDGQMDPSQLPHLVTPIIAGRADYVKANRFFSPRHFSSMPKLRLVGNSALSFISKAVSGYWNIMDPTNGYTAIHKIALQNLPLDQLDKRYFFESDMLFRLYTIRAVVTEVPLPAVYGNEASNLSISNTILTFPGKIISRFVKRIIYSYFIRDFGVCSLQLIFGILLCGFGAVFGIYHWYQSIHTGVVASAGTVLVAALPFILGFQLLLSAVLHDASNIPREPLQTKY
jgi:glycosyltransferase involved in cell wall biosynthesis